MQPALFFGFVKKRWLRKEPCGAGGSLSATARLLQGDSIVKCHWWISSLKWNVFAKSIELNTKYFGWIIFKFW